MTGRFGWRAMTPLVMALSWGCTAVPGAHRLTPANRAERAMTALQREAYRPARQELLALAGDCRSGEYGRKAILLLATAELDTGNPEGSPHAAARFASTYLMLPDATPEDVPLARALYRLGTDLSGPTDPGVEPEPLPPVAPRFDTCEPVSSTEPLPPLPTTPAVRAARVAALQAALAAHGDSLAVLQAAVRARTARIAELDAELERITELLKTGLPGHAAQERK
jgi:hypothetical protein